MKRELDGHPESVQNPTKNQYPGLPKTVALAQFLDRGWFLASRFVTRLQWAEHFVKRMKKDATEVGESRLLALAKGDEIIDEHIALGQGPFVVVVRWRVTGKGSAVSGVVMDGPEGPARGGVSATLSR
jgi:hypothetical protein